MSVFVLFYLLLNVASFSGMLILDCPFSLKKSKGYFEAVKPMSDNAIAKLKRTNKNLQHTQTIIDCAALTLLKTEGELRCP